MLVMLGTILQAKLVKTSHADENVDIESSDEFEMADNLREGFKEFVTCDENEEYFGWVCSWGVRTTTGLSNKKRYIQTSFVPKTSSYVMLIFRF